MKKRLFSLLLALVLMISLALPAFAAREEITVYNWGQYISD